MFKHTNVCTVWGANPRPLVTLGSTLPLSQMGRPIVNVINSSIRILTDETTVCKSRHYRGNIVNRKTLSTFN